MNARSMPATFAEAAALEVAAARAAGVYETGWGHKRGAPDATKRYLRLVEDGDLSLIAAAAVLRNSKPATHLYFQRLEEAGLVARDLRKGRAWYSITPAGREWLSQHGGEA